MSTSARADVTAPVVESIVVQAPIDRAFAVFTAGIGSWWPDDKHLMQTEIAEMVFEPRAGGRVADIGVDGSVSQWGTVLAYEPPSRVVFSWNINLRWEIEPDPERCSEVEVRFIAETDDRTRVQLEHRGLERHGDGWEGMRDAVGSPNGWASGLGGFARHINS